MIDMNVRDLLHKKISETEGKYVRVDLREIGPIQRARFVIFCHHNQDYEFSNEEIEQLSKGKVPQFMLDFYDNFVFQTVYA